MADVLEAHKSTPPTTLRQRCQRLPAGVDRMVLSALDKDPARRPTTARQLGGETLGEMMSRADGDTGLAEWERRMRVRLPRTRIDPLATAGPNPPSGVEPRSGG